MNTTTVVLGGGPSLTADQVRIVLARKPFVLGINDAYRIAPWVDALYACDEVWWDLHIPLVRRRGIPALYSQSEAAARNWGLTWTPPASPKAPGLCLDGDRIHWGHHSGFQALNLAVNLGARRVLLLGYDCHQADRAHWFGDHPSHMNNGLRDWTMALPWYQAAAVQLAELGVEVINCSPGSAIGCFPRADIKDAL